MQKNTRLYKALWNINLGGDILTATNDICHKTFSLLNYHIHNREHIHWYLSLTIKPGFYLFFLLVYVYYKVINSFKRKFVLRFFTNFCLNNVDEDF